MTCVFAFRVRGGVQLWREVFPINYSYWKPHMAVLSNMQEERFNTPRTNVWERFIIYISRSLSSWDLVWPWYRMKFLGLYLPTTLNRPLQVISWLVKEWSVGHSFIGWSLDLPTTGCKLRKVNLMASDNLRHWIYIYIHICHGYLWCLEPCKYLPGNWLLSPKAGYDFEWMISLFPKGGIC